MNQAAYQHVASIDYLLNKPDNLGDKLAEQGTKIRDLRAKAGEHWHSDPSVLTAVWDHLALKSWDYDLGKVLPEHRGPRTIKIRWRVANDPSSLRFQNIFKNRFYLTGAEVVNAIETHMKKIKILEKHGDKGGFLKVELVDNKKKSSIALTDSTLIKMPIVFPGPMMAFQGTFEFRVSWVGHPYHATTPECFKEKIPEIIDSGVNLFDKGFSHNVNTVIKRAFCAGVSQMVLISADISTTKRSIEIAQEHENSLFPTAGIHPTTAEPFTEHLAAEFSDLVKKHRKNIFAIGECGFDIIKVKSDNDLETIKSNQAVWFKHQIKIAAQEKLPLLLHTRGTHKEFVSLLKESLVEHPDLVLIINCFTGTAEELKDILALKKTDIYFVITGIIGSDDRGVELRDVLPLIPLDRLLLGSDAPHLTPFNMPRPFPRRNEPGFLQHTLVFVSEVLKMSFEEVSFHIVNNARKAFGLPKTFYNGKIPAGPRALDYTEFQKAEEYVPKVEKPEKKKGDKKEKVVPPAKLQIAEGSDLFLLDLEGKSIGFFVSEKEKGILTKQSLTKTPKEIFDLATDVLECKQVAPNTEVSRGANVLFTSGL